MSGASITGEANREQGAYLVLYALLAVVFFTLAAVVLDIAALRQGRRADRTAADLAVTAGVVELQMNDPTSFAGACEAAWGYVLANRTEANGTIAPPDCTGVFPSTTPCTSTTAARTASASVGPLVIEITHPVPDSSPLMLAEAQGGDIPQDVVPAADGTACERLAVRIVRERTFLFAQIAGAVGGTTDVHSVGRALTEPAPEVPAAVALETAACDALTTDPGNGILELGSTADAGTAIVDSSATICAAGSYAIRSSTGAIRALSSAAAAGEIRSFAAGSGNAAAAYAEADVTSGRVSPRPTPVLTRTGRALLDNRYKCPGCTPVRNPVGELEADRDATGPLTPAADVIYTTPCTIPPGPSQQIYATHLYIDCDDFVLDADLTLHVRSVTVKGNVTVGSTGCLAVNDTTCAGSGVTVQPADLFVRGNMTKDVKGRVALTQTFVYTGGALNIGVDPDTTVGNSTLLWTSPETGPFEDLLFWSESSATMVLGEQKAVNLVGTFAAPAAPILLNPRNGSVGVTAVMQVVGRTIRISGDGTYRLRPAGDRATGALTRQVRLIR